jgi:hypothetical protein
MKKGDSFAYPEGKFGAVIDINKRFAPKEFTFRKVGKNRYRCWRIK